MIDITGNKLANSVEQHQEDILLAHKGWFKFSPQMGVGITSFIDDDNYDSLFFSVRENFERDGLKIESLNLNTEGNIVVDAVY